MREMLTLPVPSAAKAAIGARKGRMAAGTASFFRNDGCIFIDYRGRVECRIEKLLFCYLG